jgi:hypothetical protein
MIFQAIRDDTAPEAYAYRVSLDEDQALKVLDGQHVGVYYASNHLAFTITAVPAHDAIGTAVPTSLTVDAKDVVTLHVNYKPASTAFVYPVVGGTGWEGGFRTIEVTMPPPEESEEGLVEIGESISLVHGHTALPEGLYVRSRVSAQSAPRPATNGHRFSRRYLFSECRWLPEDFPEQPVPPRDRWVEIGANCLRGGDESRLLLGMSIHGWYWYEPDKKIWILEDEEECDKWGPFKPAMVHCEPRPVAGWDYHHLVLYGNFRLKSGTTANALPVAECITLWGVLTLNQPHKHERESIISNAHDGGFGEPWTPCEWPQQ